MPPRPGRPGRRGRPSHRRCCRRAAPGRVLVGRHRQTGSVSPAKPHNSDGEAALLRDPRGIRGDDTLRSSDRATCKAHDRCLVERIRQST
jgi:hypothetical protein